MDLKDFLPKYPYIEEKSPFEPYDIPFAQAITDKKEFYDEKLEPTETAPRDQLFKHQNLVARYMSQHTLYNGLLLYHEMGTGKSLSAFGTTEAIFKSKDPAFRRAFVIVSGKGLESNLKRQLVYSTALGTSYLPDETGEELSAQTKTRRINDKVSKNYTFSTYEIFAKGLRKLSDDQLRRDYSDCIFILDEVHHLHPNSPRERNVKKEDVLMIYSEFLRLFGVIRNKKVLLLTGTPMRNDVSELAFIFNLILPLDQRIPVGKAFEREFLVKSTEGYDIVRPERLVELKDKFRGRISFVSSSKSDVTVRYVGTDILDTGSINFNLTVDTMSVFQSTEYLRVHQEDLTGNTTRGIQLNSRLTSNFVFPAGEDDKNKWSPQFKNELSRLSGLRKYSSKFASTISSIIESPNQLSFVYSRFVEKSGTRLFARILRLYGYSQCKGTERNPGRRFILLRSGAGSAQTVQKLIRYFNNPRNAEGRYAQVIIGSGFISEGFSFMNVQQIHILTPHWNYAETLQAIARGIRAGSHRGLGQNPVVSVYQHCATVPKAENIEVSVDVYLYLLSYRKDRSIKAMDRLLKESAFDCALTYDRNARYNIAGSRQCDYTTCSYQCDGIIYDSPPYLDLSTYRLYYNTDEKKDILAGMKEYFRKENSSSMDDLVRHFVPCSMFDLLAVLDNVVSNNVPLIDSGGKVSYLREFNNAYTLVHNPNEVSDQFTEFYSDHTIETQVVPFERVLDSLYQMSLGHLVGSICASKSGDDIQEMIKVLPLIVQEMFIEAAVAAKAVDKKSLIQDAILDMFSTVIKKVGRVTVSLLNPSSIRCFENGKWDACAEDFQGKLEESQQSRKKQLEDEPYHGFVRGGDLYIARKTSSEIKDKRKKREGAKCVEGGWPKDKIILILMEQNVPLPAGVEIPKKGRSKLLNEEWSVADRKKIMYWNSLTKLQLCNRVQEWFSQNNLLLE